MKTLLLYHVAVCPSCGPFILTFMFKKSCPMRKHIANAELIDMYLCLCAEFIAYKRRVRKMLVFTLASFNALHTPLVAELWSTRLSLHLGSNREHSALIISQFY